MITVSILEEFDIIKPTDYCRPLQIVSMNGGLSDYYSFECAFSGTPENNAKWTRVDQVFGKGWYGEQVQSLLENVNVPYEFIRGPIPDPHLYGKTRAEKRMDYEEYLNTHVMPYGKYREMLLKNLVEAHPSYATWAEQQGIIKSQSDFL